MENNEEEIYRKMIEERERNMSNLTLPPNLTVPLDKQKNKQQKLAKQMGDDVEKQFNSRNTSSLDNYLSEPIHNLPSKGLFYPDETEIRFRAATVSEIRNFSVMNDRDPMDVLKKTDALLKECIAISIGDSVYNHTYLSEADKFYMLLRVREITFKDKPSKITVTGVNSDGVPVPIDLTAFAISEFKFQEGREKLMKYYDAIEKCFIIPVENEMVRIYVPTVGVGSRVAAVVRDMSREGVFDQAMMSIAPFYFKTPKEVTELSLSQLSSNILNWSTERYLKISQFCAALADAATPRLHVDENGKPFQGGDSEAVQGVTAEINFQGGFKRLFVRDVVDLFD